MTNDRFAYHILGSCICFEFIEEKGQDSGHLFIMINSMSQSTIQIPIPVWITLFLHTLQLFKCNEMSAGSAQIYVKNNIGSRADLLIVKTGLNECVNILIDFDKSLLYYSDYPPDANKGFDFGYVFRNSFIMSSSGAVLDEESGEELFIRSRSSSLGSPDFSMPYNVITLTCTAIALMFGSLVNSLIRDMKCLKLSK